ncbi:hypothetical protein [Streptomyces sp. NBC_01187]|uniref:hypothetical protein n=1 Tax=Streptomyces sp. NBC_01187 TaxID=2903766 RepID=UPI002F9107E9|nr:hypothetical protein OG220_42140 [Streptomyces sp. NBC_01187]
MATAIVDTAATRRAQNEASAQDNRELTAHLGRLVDARLDEALDLQRLSTN